MKNIINIKQIDFSGSNVLEIGCGKTFNSYNFFKNTKIQHLTAIDMQCVEDPQYTQRNVNVDIIVGDILESEILQKLIMYEPYDFVFAARFFNRQDDQECERLLRQISKIKSSMYVFEEYKKDKKEKQFIGVDGLNKLSLNIFPNYQNTIFRNARILPQRYANSGLASKIYRYFKPNCDVIVLEKID